MKSLPKYIKRLCADRYRQLLSALPNQRQAHHDFLMQSIATRGIPSALGFSQSDFRQRVLLFIDSMATGPHSYRYAPSISTSTLYSSVYACLTKALFGQISRLDPRSRLEWARYLDAFQSPDDGLYRDPVIAGNLYENSDWWGARHLLLHMIPAYSALGHLPRYRFAFLDEYKSLPALKRWLDLQNWEGTVGSDDVDNKIMNIVGALQYERDSRSDHHAGRAAEFIIEYLSKRIDPETGIWGKFDTSNPGQLSRAVQFAYHLYPAYIYDGVQIKHADRIIDLTLMTQNELGGYGAEPNSSACEDIDSIDLLIRLSRISRHRRSEVELSIRRALVWIFANQNDDGGFVFRRNEAFVYGHASMSSGKNESAMFPTWFRTLSIAYATSFLGNGAYVLHHCPGLQRSIDDGRGMLDGQVDCH